MVVGLYGAMGNGVAVLEVYDRDLARVMCGPGQRRPAPKPRSPERRGSAAHKVIILPHRSTLLHPPIHLRPFIAVPNVFFPAMATISTAVTELFGIKHPILLAGAYFGLLMVCRTRP